MVSEKVRKIFAVLILSAKLSALGAVVGDLLFVTGLTIRLFCQEVVGGNFARPRCVVTILTCNTDIFDVKLV